MTAQDKGAFPKRPLRIWSELVPYRELQERSLLRTLARWNVRPMVAVTPDSLADLPAVLTAARDEDVSVGLWPMIDEADGRWLSVWSARAFGAHLEGVLAMAERAGVMPAEVAFDLEPPMPEVQRMVHNPARGLWWCLVRSWPRGGVEEVEAQIASVRRRGPSVLAVVAPMLGWDRAAGTGWSGWERAFGTPVNALSFDAVTIMAYTSLLRGYVPWLSEADIASLLDAWCRAAHGRFGRRAGVSLGISGGGVLGDERAYDSVDELARDAAVARQAGLEELSLYGLSGALAAGGLERWLEVLVRTPAAPARPAVTWRSAAADTAGRLASRLLTRRA